MVTDLNLSTFTHACDALLADLALTADADIQGRAEAARDRLKRERLKILVIGEFSRGKSTFVNALIGSPVLPSKVNPTTATINILRGAAPATARIEYLEGEAQVIDLPEQQVNRFLDSIVTVANANAQSIRTVTIQVPGRLELILADIVDTPGVNDLDQAREEVTFSYLREADAAVMVLDASQPISESERAFLVDKVLGADVNRIVFVINKADEILYDGELKDIERICEYVRTRLREHVGIENPEVHAVASKSALRARYRQEEDPFPLPFAAFERRLVQFATSQALSNPDRLGVHLDRAEALVTVQLERIQEAIEGTRRDTETIEGDLAAAEAARRAVDTRVERLDSRLATTTQQLAKRISGYTRQQIEALRSRLTERLTAARTDDDIEDFRQGLSGELRGLVSDVERLAEQERARFSREVADDFSDLLGGVGTEERSGRGGRSLQNYREFIPETVAGPSQQGPGFDTQEMAVGFGLGFVGAALFGPVGIAAGVVGTYLVNKSKREKHASELARLERDRMLQALHAACAGLAQRAEHVGQEIAEREAKLMVDAIRGAAQVREQRARSACVAAQEAARGSITERQAQQERLQNRAGEVATLESRLRQLRAEYQT